MPRLFVGVELESDARAAAAAAVARLREALAVAHVNVAAKWVPVDNLHITTWFIGEVADDRARAIEAALAPSMAQPPFDIELSGLGAFPPTRMPRVLWIGVAAGAAELGVIYRDVGTRLAPLGFEPERREYSAHLTIARVREGGPRPDLAALREVLRKTASDLGRSRVGAVTLFRSRLSPKGAVYEPLLRVPLV